MASNRQILVKELPRGPLEERHFELREAPMPTPGPGEVLTRTIYLSLDPANRAWMQGATYRAPVVAGEVMAGFTVAQVVESRDPGFKADELVECESGWQEHAVHPARALVRLEPRGPLSHHLSVLGITGLTAYFGLMAVGRPRKDETVVVSAAAGATGNVAGQIARIQGCRSVGLAGSDEKCAWLTGELGFDAAINYKTETLRSALKEHCPRGIDIYFDNTGGQILEAALFRMNPHGRVVCCGAVSQYDTATPAPGPRGVPGLIVTKRLRVEGFLVSDFFRQRAEATEQLAHWLADGRLVVREDILEGLEVAPRGLIGLLRGENLGKRMVRVSPEPAAS
jgi:NADPH-dependent curcumin reductase CurA